jgi:hypothetical protein
MGPMYMMPVVDRNVVMRRIPLISDFQNIFVTENTTAMCHLNPDFLLLQWYGKKDEKLAQITPGMNFQPPSVGNYIPCSMLP